MPATVSRFDVRPLGLALGALVCSALGAAPAWSHGIQSNLEKLSPLSEQVRREFLLQSEFSTGEPAGEAAVRLWRPDGETIEMGRTDSQGRLRFAMPAELSDEWEVQVDAGPGHRDYLELSQAVGGQPQGAASLSRRTTGLGPLLSRRESAASLPLVGGLAMGLAAGGAMLFRRRRG
jgi:nickel transport protein